MADRLRIETAESGHVVYNMLRETQREWATCSLKVYRPEGGDRKVEIELPVEIKCIGKKRPSFVSVNGDQVYKTELRFSDRNTFIVDVTFGVLDWELEGAIVSFDWHQSVSVLDHIEGCS